MPEDRVLAHLLQSSPRGNPIAGSPSSPEAGTSYQSHELSITPSYALNLSFSSRPHVRPCVHQPQFRGMPAPQRGQRSLAPATASWTLYILLPQAVLYDHLQPGPRPGRTLPPKIWPLPCSTLVLLAPPGLRPWEVHKLFLPSKPCRIQPVIISSSVALILTDFTWTMNLRLQGASSAESALQLGTCH